MFFNNTKVKRMTKKVIHLFGSHKRIWQSDNFQRIMEQENSRFKVYVIIPAEGDEKSAGNCCWWTDDKDDLLRAIKSTHDNFCKADGLIVVDRERPGAYKIASDFLTMSVNDF